VEGFVGNLAKVTAVATGVYNELTKALNETTEVALFKNAHPRVKFN